jgi:hypothetical protein
MSAMSEARWAAAIGALRAQGAAVRSAAERVEECRDDTAGAGYARLTTAVALSYVCEGDYMRCAAALLHAHLSGRRPPARLPVERVWARPVRQSWKEWVLTRRRGVWQAVPGPRLLAQVEGAMPDASLEEVTTRLKDLQASLHGHRLHPRMYEKFIPDRSRVGRVDGAAVLGAGDPAPTLPGFPDRGHWVNLNFARGSGVRIQPDRLAEAAQLKADEWAVHQRAQTFGDAVLRLLELHHAPAQQAPPGAARLRGAAGWIGREQQLVPHLTPWPSSPTAPQGVTVAGLGWLVLMLAGIPLTVAMRAHFFFDHPKLSLLASAGVLALGAALVHRAGPRLLSLPGKTAAVPGIAAAVAAVIVWQAQGPVAGYYFAGPYDRYERQYGDSCLAAGPYRSGAVQAEVVGATLIVRPTGGGTTLRLGPAKEGGTQPLRPVDRATSSVLSQYSCDTP